jgi:hypothetical protein
MPPVVKATLPPTQVLRMTTPKVSGATKSRTVPTKNNHAPKKAPPSTPTDVMRSIDDIMCRKEKAERDETQPIRKSFQNWLQPMKEEPRTKPHKPIAAVVSRIDGKKPMDPRIYKLDPVAERKMLKRRRQGVVKVTNSSKSTTKKPTLPIVYKIADHRDRA